MFDFDLTKIKAMVFDVDGVLSCSTIAMDEEGQPLRTLNVKDGYAIQLAVKRGLVVAIISGGRSQNIVRRYEYLGVRHIYMGDDIPDYEVMQRVGCPVCPADAVPEIKAISRYVSPFSGGSGAARDVVEQVLKAQGGWMTDKVAFGW